MYRQPTPEPLRRNKQGWESYREELVNDSPSPGELPLEDSWALEIPGLCQRAGVPSKSIASLCRDIGTEGSSPGIAAVTALDHGIRELLEGIQLSTPPSHEDKDNRQLLIDDELVCEHSHDFAKSQPGRAASSAELERLRENKEKVDPEDEYIGQSLPILRMFERICEFNQPSDTTDNAQKPVLILGETGVGKTDLAELIHRHSRQAGNLCQQHATSMKGRDEIIIRQNWVGYGTNSVLDKADPGGEVGIIQQHAGGTIFLDEFHTTPPWFQTFLLQVLDRKQIPLAHGTGDPVVPDVRLIFASNKTLVELEASESPVQNDFLDRLRRWIIQVPPLRDRKEDIPSFVEKWCVGFRRDYRFLLALIRYDWPGNVRELHDLLNIAKRKAARASKKLRKAARASKKLTLDHLEIENSAVIEAVRQMPEVEAQREVMQFLVQTFKGQGLRKGKGLNKHLVPRQA